MPCVCRRNLLSGEKAVVRIQETEDKQRRMGNGTGMAMGEWGMARHVPRVVQGGWANEMDTMDKKQKQE
jgi:hypothetical protein